MIDTSAVQNLELSLTERWGHLVFDYFDTGFAADNFIAIFHCAGAANVQTYRRVELQCVTTGSGFRVTEHNADLHADLVDEDHQAIGILDVTGDLAQRL